MGQYQPREPIMLFIHIEKFILSLFGLFNEVDEYTREILTKIKSDFKKGGLPHKLL